MRYHRGMTLIEIIIYIGLLSVLLTTVINYIFESHLRDVRLSQEIFDIYEIQ